MRATIDNFSVHRFNVMFICFWKDAINSMAYFTIINGKPDYHYHYEWCSKQSIMVITMTTAMY